MTADALWVTNGPGMTCGARRLGDAGDGRVWIDVCIIGQHLPQMCRPEELHPLTADGCARLGLCDHCLGFGDLDPGLAADMLTAARGVDQVRQRCPNCSGTGRPAVRVTIRRDGSGVSGEVRHLPHAYVPPLDDIDLVLAEAFQAPPDMCLACSMSADAQDSRGKALHQ